YFDDFEFTPTGQPDLIPTPLQWNTQQGGVDFSYQVTGGDLPQDTTAALYWSADDHFDSQTDTLIYDTPIEHPQGQYGPFYVPNSVLNPSRLAIDKYLLLVVDPGNQIAESDEGNNLLALPIPDINLLSATTKDSKSVTIDYEVTGTSLDAVPLR